MNFDVSRFFNVNISKTKYLSGKNHVKENEVIITAQDSCRIFIIDGGHRLYGRHCLT